MSTNNDIVFIYIGATQNKDSSALISWVTPKQPVAPVNPSNPENIASYIKQSLQLAVIVLVTYFML
jgi:hypothetical protein